MDTKKLKILQIFIRNEMFNSYKKKSLNRTRVSSPPPPYTHTRKIKIITQYNDTFKNYPYAKYNDRCFSFLIRFEKCFRKYFRFAGPIAVTGKPFAYYVGNRDHATSVISKVPKKPNKPWLQPAKSKKRKIDFHQQLSLRMACNQCHFN